MSEEKNLTFGKKNYMIMIGGVLVLILGFIIMASDSGDGFGTTAMTVGPIIVLIGLIAQFVAILHRPKTEE